MALESQEAIGGRDARRTEEWRQLDEEIDKARPWLIGGLAVGVALILTAVAANHKNEELGHLHYMGNGGTTAPPALVSDRHPGK